MMLEMDANQIAGLFNDEPGTRIGYRENSGIGFNPLFSDILSEPVCQFLGKEHRLRFSSAFRVSNDGLVASISMGGGSFKTSPTLKHPRTMYPGRRRLGILLALKMQAGEYR